MSNRQSTKTVRRTSAMQVLGRLNATSALTSAAFACSAVFAGHALALPQDGNVVEGQAEIVYGANSVEIVQGSDRVIIEWSSFDVGVDESVNFVQPSQLASALNRVLSGQSSAILGSLTGNGQITIVNPAGIHFGATANVDVAAITATTIDIINANFMANNLAFDQFNDEFANATVTNDGSITVQDSGLAALVAPGVANNGIIAARTGAVVLASGTAFTVDPYGDGLIQFAVNAPTTEAPEGMDALVSNSGEIYADGGTVILTAEAVSGIVDSVVNMDGVIQAQTIEGRNGQIALVGGSGAGAVNVAGTLDASGNDAGEAGGTVHVLGDQVALNVGANVDVSGAAGGGEALIGGAYQGGAQAAGAALQYQQTASGLNIISDTAFETDGYTPTSDVTLFDAGATANASATDNGDGGDVVVWGNDEATFYGTIAATGGNQGGNGGQVELSGQRVTVAGDVDLGATVGQAGHMLIDPTNLCAANSPLSCSAFPFLVTTATIVSALESGADVTLDTSNPPGGGDAGQAGNIEIVHAITVDFANNASADDTAIFTLLADGGIVQDGAVTGINGSLGINYQAKGGEIDINAAVTVGGAADVTMLSQFNIRVDASIQNGGTGATSLVAGWDGATTDIATILATPSAYGVGGGALFIGDGTQTSGIHVGSQLGDTSFAGAAMTLQGSAATFNAFAMAGFIGDSFGSYDMDGDIFIALSDESGTGGALTLNAGGATNTFAQVGHGGETRAGNSTGDIIVLLAGDVTLTADESYAQIGHGGNESGGNRTGDITLFQVGNVSLFGAGFYAQIGHGGVDAGGGRAGDITIVEASNLTMVGGGASQYAQVGHGQADEFPGALFFDSGTAEGSIDLTITGETSLVNGGGAPWYIGHRATTVTDTALSLVSGTLDFDDTATTGAFAITDDAAGMDFAAKMAANLAFGDVTLGATNGTAGATGGMTVGSSFIYDSANDLNLFSTTDIRFDASVQNNGAGNVSVVAGWDAVTFDIADILSDVTTYGISSGIFIGDGTQVEGIAVGARFGDSNFAGAEMILQGSDQQNFTFAQAGFRNPGELDFDIDGAINIALSDGTGTPGDLIATAGTKLSSYVQVGHGGSDYSLVTGNDGDVAGDITILLANDVIFTAVGQSAHAHLGHGGLTLDGAFSGDIVIAQANDLTFAGGGPNAYAQLGHGGLSSTGSKTGDIIIDLAGSLAFAGSSKTQSFALLGHGGAHAIGSASGDIAISQAGDLMLTAGTGWVSFAQIGHGGSNIGGGASGAITITGADNLILTSNRGRISYTQIGHGGFRYDGAASGAISIDVLQDLNLKGGDLESDAYAQIGHGAVSTSSTGLRSGDIDLDVAGETSLVNGAGTNADWMIGHRSGTIVEVSDADITLITGTLDFDDTNSSTSFGITDDAAGTDFAAKMATNLLVGNVTLGATNGRTGANGGMAVNAPFIYASATDFSLFSATNIRFGASVQNSSTGNVNVVAGWDQTTFDIATILGDVTTYGLSSGIFIGDGSQIEGIAVGSRFGGSNFAAHSMTLQGSDTTDFGFAMAGFRDTGADDADGAISIALSDGTGAAGDLEAAGGSAVLAYAQVGHGGWNMSGSSGSYAGDITIILANDLIFSANGSGSYGQLGHGGITAQGSHSGAISVLQARDITFTGGSGDEGSSYVQFGHGGFGADGDHSGQITIAEARNVSFTSATTQNGYAQLGHGGRIADGDISGDITITQAATLSLSSVGQIGSYAQLGHGGYDMDGTLSGAIDITVVSALTLTGQDVATILGQYAVLGHGNEFGSFDSDAGQGVSGDVMVRVGGAATLTDAFIGHMTDDDTLYTSGNTFVGVGALLTTDAASALNSAASGELRIYLGSVAADAVDPAALLNGVAHEAAQAPNNQGAFAFGSGPYAPDLTRGNFAYYTLDGVWNYFVETAHAANIVAELEGGNAVSLDTTQGFTQFGAVFDWDGAPSFIEVNAPVVYTSDNPLNLLATGGVTFNASVQNSGAGSVNVVAGWDAVTTDIATILSDVTTYGISSGIFIGDGTQADGIAVGARFGESVFAAHSLTLTGSNTTADAFAQAGFSNPAGRNFEINGAITVALSDGTGTPGDLTATAGSQSGSHVQVGHGGGPGTTGNNPSGRYNGAITILLANDLSFSASTGGLASYAQLGHGGADVQGVHGGAIEIVQARDLSFAGGNDDYTYAQLGHGGYNSDRDHRGRITITEARDLSFTGGAGDDAYAQLGHGGALSGAGGGRIIFDLVRDLLFMGGTGERAYSQLGHGGHGANAKLQAGITIGAAGDLTVAAGAGDEAYAQLGNGGFFSFGAFTGKIDVTVLGNLALTGVDPIERYAVIGHGGLESKVVVDGDVFVKVGEAATLTNAGIGHLFDDPNSIRFGTTFVGVDGVLTADATSWFVSAPSGRLGELRIYLTSAAYDAVDPAALLNRVAHGADQGPNDQGPFDFADGPYDPGTSLVGGPVIDGNFNYYIQLRPTTTAGTDPVTFVATALLVNIGGQSNPEQGPTDALAGRSAPDSGNTIDDVFADPFSLLGGDPSQGGDLSQIAPAAGGQTCQVVPGEGGGTLTCSVDEAGAPSDLSPAGGGAGPLGAFTLDPQVDLDSLFNVWQ